jgi:hypothetical protein
MLVFIYVYCDIRPSNDLGHKQLSFRPLFLVYLIGYAVWRRV